MQAQGAWMDPVSDDCPFCRCPLADHVSASYVQLGTDGVARVTCRVLATGYASFLLRPVFHVPSPPNRAACSC